MALRSLSVLCRFRLVLVLLAVIVTAGTLWSAIRKPTATQWRGMDILHGPVASTETGDLRPPPSGRQVQRGSWYPPTQHHTNWADASDSSSSKPEAIDHEVQFVNTDALQLVANMMNNPDTNSSTLHGPTSAIPPTVGATIKPATTGESCDRACRWGRQQETRRRRVADTCSALRGRPVQPALRYRLTPEALRSLTHLLVLPSHRLIYCYVPKVSCTNWKRILLVAKGVAPSAGLLEQRATHLAADAHLRALSSYPLHTAARLLREYQTFMFARHPFERLLSAYVDKFQLDYPSSKHFRQANAAKMARYAARSARPVPKLRDGTVNITFAQFGRFVADRTNRQLEPHWQEMYRQCQPCLVDYDYLGDYGSLKEDADAIMAATGLNQTFPESTNPTGSSQREHLQRYFSGLTDGEIEALRRRYAVDFQMFGYTVPPYLLKETTGAG